MYLIRNESDYEKALARLDELLNLPKLLPSERVELETLVSCIMKYEEFNF